jgi:predicted AlkP superfamily pyrophosphatase or phosphodiesterase
MTSPHIPFIGLYTQALIPTFPTLTFPNHYAIVTGLYPSWNGIVANTMYDPQINATFYLGSPESLNPQWWWGEPLWVTTTKNGQLSGTLTISIIPQICVVLRCVCYHLDVRKGFV